MEPITFFLFPQCVVKFLIDFIHYDICVFMAKSFLLASHSLPL